MQLLKYVEDQQKYLVKIRLTKPKGLFLCIDPFLDGERKEYLEIPKRHFKSFLEKFAEEAGYKITIKKKEE